MKNKLLMICLVLIMLLSVFCAACAKDALNDDTTNDSSVAEGQDVLPAKIKVGIVVDADLVNIRQEAGMEGRILDTASRGAAFKINGLSDDGKWYEVFCRGDKAYISTDYLWVDEWSTDDTFYVASIIENSTNVLIRPDVSAAVVFTAYKNNRFVLLDSSAANGWYKLSYKANTAYINESHVMIKECAMEEVFFK